VRDRTELKTHPNAWVNLTEDYITSLMDALAGHGVRISAAWLDPIDPRDATLVLQRPGRRTEALVWDEETGLRAGRFISGRQGERTELAEAAHLGGGVLPAPQDAVRRLLLGVREPRVVHRLHTDVRDGFDDFLRSRH
jgi:hypothetical protein